MKFIIIILLTTTSLYAYYGNDSRVEFYNLKDDFIKKAANSVAYQVDRPWLRGVTFARYWKVLNYSLEQRGICKGERFINQPTTRSNCSGVLIAPDILLTLGNCLTDHYCKNDLYYWMFDYKISKENVINEKWRSKNFYKCKKILTRVHSPNNNISYTVLRLNKKVKDRQPVKIDFTEVKNNEELTTIGHPSGLPMKISTGGYIKEIGETYFSVSSDISGGTRGAALFNSKTGQLRGILAAGTKNYDDYTAEGCTRAQKEDENFIQEFAIRIDKIDLSSVDKEL